MDATPVFGSRALQRIFILTILANSLILNGLTAEELIESSTISYEDEMPFIEKFRALVEEEIILDYMREDAYLIRWIRDKDYNLEEASAKLRKSLQWRKENQIDSILEEDFSDIHKTCPYSIEGHDIHNRPLLTLSLGTCDLRKMSLSGNMPRVFRNIYFALEQAATTVQQVRLTEEGRNVTSGVLLFDVAGYNKRQHGCLACLPMLSTLLQTYENNYPAYLEKAYFINVPRSAHSMINFMMPLASPVSRKLTRFFGLNKDEWQPAILETISPDQLPPQFGGNKVKQHHGHEHE